MFGPNNQVVWFKRDLRVHDNAALMGAIAAGPVVPVYIVEPGLWAQPDMSLRHYQFLRGCLMSLGRALHTLGLRLVIRVGDAETVLSDIHDRFPFTALWSHQETWNHWSRLRNERINLWCQRQGVIWCQPPQNGVLTRDDCHDGWARKWQRFMRAKPVPAPEAHQIQPCPLDATQLQSASLPSPFALGLAMDERCKSQPSGRYAAIETLNHFLNYRGQYYLEHMASPLTAQAACSRVSVYLSFGVLSVREVFHQVQQRLGCLRQDEQLLDDERQAWIKSLRAYLHRLRWHCQFIQKLEDNPDIELTNLHTGYDDVRLVSGDLEAERLDAWRRGQTGYPLIDAGMRALRETGWINFRLRALLISFACYHLWLDWHQPALYLARLFTDYEPGIHYNQVQMRAGTTGVNALRILNPVEQSERLDPEGIFIRKWVPELGAVPLQYLHQPWLCSEPPADYPTPIVCEEDARKTALRFLKRLRKSPEHAEEKAKILAQQRDRRLKKSTHYEGGLCVGAACKSVTQLELPFLK